MAENDRSKIEGSTQGFIKLFADAKSKRLVAATAIGHAAGEIIGGLSAAITAKAKLDDLAKTIYPYPTRSEAIRRAADMYQFEKLTPSIKKWLRTWVKLMR